MIKFDLQRFWDKRRRRRWWQRDQLVIGTNGDYGGENSGRRPGLTSRESESFKSDHEDQTATFSWLGYGVFFMLGISMLWAWNMFLAAGPYFSSRFAGNSRIVANFQSAELAVSTVANFLMMLLLSHLQRPGSFFRRIIKSLMINLVGFTLLALSTRLFTDTSSEVYFTFFILIVLVTSISCGLNQNGSFAFASQFGHTRYMHAVVTGQAMAGIAPCIVQLVLALAFPDRTEQSKSEPNLDDKGQHITHPNSSSTAALLYFIAALIVSISTLVMFTTYIRIYGVEGRKGRKGLPFSKIIRLIFPSNCLSVLHSRGNSAKKRSGRPEREDSRLSTSVTTAEMGRRMDELDANTLSAPASSLPANTSNTDLTTENRIPLIRLFKKLLPFSLTVFITFGVSMFFPVFTQKIISVKDDGTGLTKPIYQARSFIALAFLVWNVGDLVGRLFPLWPVLGTSMINRPWLMVGLSIGRIIFLPFYGFCNISGRPNHSWIHNDYIYLLLIQFPFGVSNGYLGSLSMMAAPVVVAAEERREAGAFLGVCLTGGLLVGSLLSFSIANI